MFYMLDGWAGIGEKERLVFLTINALFGQQICTACLVDIILYTVWNLSSSTAISWEMFGSSDLFTQ